MGQIGTVQTLYVLSMETVGKSKRAICGTAMKIFFTCGQIHLAIVSWSLGDWRKIQLVITLPYLIFITYFQLLPQSIRWLLVKRKFSQARLQLDIMARRNNVEALDDH